MSSSCLWLNSLLFTCSFFLFLGYQIIKHLFKFFIVHLTTSLCGKGSSCRPDLCCPGSIGSTPGYYFTPSGCIFLSCCRSRSDYANSITGINRRSIPTPGSRLQELRRRNFLFFLTRDPSRDCREHSPVSGRFSKITIFSTGGALIFNQSIQNIPDKF